jgi:hypothetical protein
MGSSEGNSAIVPFAPEFLIVSSTFLISLMSEVERAVPSTLKFKEFDLAPLSTRKPRRSPFIIMKVALTIRRKITISVLELALPKVPEDRL